MISIIIVNYNTGMILKDCLESLYLYEDPVNFEIVIIDNRSDDDSREIISGLSDKHKNIKFIFNKEKVSFSEANNTGIEASTGEFVLIMNPDIIFTEAVFNKLTEDLKNIDGLGAVIPMLLGQDGNFQNRYFQKYPGLLQYIYFYSVIAKLFQSSETLTRKYLHIYSEDFDKEIEYVDQIPCAFFFTMRNVIMEAGMMDDRYELFFEDVDLSYQIAKKHKLAVDTSIKVTHLGGASFKTSDDYWLYGRFITSMIVFFRKNYSGLKTNTLKFIAGLNSRIVIFSGRLIPGNEDKDRYRSRKHRYFLDQLKNSKF
ncbi:MAG TPA: glycosyltransferase [Ignavibacteria bacterium]|nr:glycosyltransferase [Ignavibacteria bacterium]HMR39495.1 glycosyltransferase [Ignavibacteria bacterium]